MTTIVTPAEVRGLMAPGIGNDALTGVIAREEDWLANDPIVGIGQLEGSRTETFVRAWPLDAPRMLARPATLVAVTDGGVVLGTDEVTVVDRCMVARASGAWRFPIVVTYEPDDREQVRRVVLELVRLALSASPFHQEGTEGHSYTRSRNVEQMRRALARPLRPHRRTASVPFGGAS